MELLKALRLLGDSGRLRVLRLLQREDLSVAELQEITGMGQSRISMQLSQLKAAGFVEVRRSGRQSIYRLKVPPGAAALLDEVLRRAADEVAAVRADDEGLQLALRRRKDTLRSYFDELAGRFGRNYVPGRSWKSLGELCLRLLPPLVVADLGAGEGTLALLLAQSAAQVIAVDNSGKMVEYGAALAERNAVANLEYRLGDMEELPLATGEIDLALMHQSLHHALRPATAVAEAFRALRPGGRLVIMDLLRHEFGAARELYADVHLGFTQVELLGLLREAGFERTGVDIVDREEAPPHFQTVMAIGFKPSLP